MVSRRGVRVGASIERSPEGERILQIRGQICGGLGEGEKR